MSREDATLAVGRDSEIRVRALPADASVPPDAFIRIGLVLLSTDATSEADFARLVVGDAVRLHGNRIAFENPTTPESLARTGPQLQAAAADLLPGSAFSSIYFACTSASAVLGPDGVAAAIRTAKPGAAVVTPVSAVLAALTVLEARRVSVLAPYSRNVTARTVAPLDDAGLTIDRITCWGLEDDRDMARVRPEVIAEEAARAIDPSSDALFISCTALRAAAAVAAIEAAIARPVVTSNQAAAWACRGIAGLEVPRPEAGRLFTRPFVKA